MDEDEERPFPRITLWEFLGGMLIGALSWYSMISNPIMRFFLSMGDEAERRSSERRTHISGEGLEPLSLGIRRLAVAIVALLLAGTTGLSAEAEGMPQRSNPRLTCEPWPSCAGTDEGPPPVPTRPQVVGAYLNQCGRAPTLKHCIQDFYNNEKWACQAYCGDLHFPRRTLEDCVASVARFRRLTHQEPALAASRFRFFLERWCGVQTRARS